MNISKTSKTIILSTLLILGVSGVFLNLIYPILAVLIIVFGFLCFKKVFSTRFTAICLMVFIFASVWTLLRTPKPDELVQYNNYLVTLKGDVISRPISADGKTKFEFKSDTVSLKSSTKNIIAKSLVTVGQNDEIKLGDKLVLKGRVKTLNRAVNPNQFDYGKYLENYEIFTFVYADEVSFLEQKSTIFRKFLRKIDDARNRIIALHDKNLDENESKILGGIVFGNDAVPPTPEIKEDFINSGLYHLLAASGMNVGLIFGIWFFLCSRLKAPKTFSIITGGILVIIYALMTGLPPSIVRATWMLELILIGKLFDRDADNLALLAFVCAIMLIYNPMMGLDVGFQLSFIVTFGLILCTEPIMEKIKFIPKWLSGWFVIPFIAQLWVAPVQIFYFNTFSLYSLIANMSVIPFIAIVSFIGFIGSIFALIPYVGTTLCAWSDKINEPLLQLLALIANYISHLPHAIQYVSKPHLSLLLIIYVLLIILTLSIKNNFKEKWQKIMIFMLFLIILMVPLHKICKNHVSIVIFSLQKGDSIFISAPHHKNYLINLGVGNPKKKSHPFKYSISPYMKAHGINKLEGLILTETPQENGLKELSKYLKPSKIYGFEEYSFDNFKKLKDLKVNVINANKILEESEKFEIEADENRNILIKNGKFDMLILNGKLSLKIPQKIDIVVVNSENDKVISDEETINKINPETIIITGGEPKDKNLLWKLYDGKRAIYKTTLDGTLRVKSNGDKFILENYYYPNQTWELKFKLRLAIN